MVGARTRSSFVRGSGTPQATRSGRRTSDGRSNGSTHWGPRRSFYFDTIVGAEECQRREPCDLSAGIETDDDAGTVTFHLVEPDPDFLNKLTMPFAFAVPAGTPDTPAGTTPIPATGPYMIERYTPGRGGEVVLVRNPEFSQWSAARPDGFPDRIVFRLEPDSDRQLNKQVDDVLEGRADLMYHPSTRGSYRRARDHPRGAAPLRPGGRHGLHVPQRTHPLRSTTNGFAER